MQVRISFLEKVKVAMDSTKKLEEVGEDHFLGEEGDDGLDEKDVDEVDVFVEKEVEDS
jgi:hypothetical protein